MDRARTALIALCLAWLPMALGAQQTAVTAPVSTGESILNLGPLLDVVNGLKSELRQYHDCTGAAGCYQKDLDAQAELAMAFLRKRVTHRDGSEPLALVLDVDETSLSNWEEMSGANFDYNSKDFNAWVESAQAPSIPGTLRIYKLAEELGVKVIFITGRPETQRASTETNLRMRGFEKWEQVILRKTDQQKLSAEEFKSAARGEMAKKFRIVLNVGDQWSDLRGANAAEFSVKYPDPYYFIK